MSDWETDGLVYLSRRDRNARVVYRLEVMGRDKAWLCRRMKLHSKAMPAYFRTERWMDKTNQRFAEALEVHPLYFRYRNFDENGERIRQKLGEEPHYNEQGHLV